MVFQRSLDGTQTFARLQLKLLAGAINFLHRHIRVDEGVEKRMANNPLFSLFNELSFHKKDSLNKIFTDSVHDSSAVHVGSFVSSILHQGIFSVSAMVASVIYLSRFKEVSHITLHAWTWRPLFLTTLLIADKAWEDKPVRNSSLAKLFPVLTNLELNKLENVFLRVLSFNVVIKPELFTTFCEKLLNEKVDQEIVKAVVASEYGQGLTRELEPFGGVVSPESLAEPMGKAGFLEDDFGVYPMEDCLRRPQGTKVAELWSEMLESKGKRVWEGGKKSGSGGPPKRGGRLNLGMGLQFGGSSSSTSAAVSTNSQFLVKQPMINSAAIRAASTDSKSLFTTGSRGREEEGGGRSRSVVPGGLLRTKVQPILRQSLGGLGTARNFSVTPVQGGILWDLDL